MKRLFCHIVFLLLVITSGVCQETVFSGLRSDIKRADKFYENESYQNALELYLLLEGKEKGGEDIYLKLARTYYKLYDFENSVMDGIQGITHRFRSKEFEMRNELQRYIQRILSFSETSIYEFARFNMEGVESSGRASCHTCTAIFVVFSPPENHHKFKSTPSLCCDFVKVGTTRQNSFRLRERLFCTV